MTEKIYERQSYLKELQTEVTDCHEEDGRVYIKLKETIFFPEEGGQYADTGMLICGDRQIYVLDGELTGQAAEGNTDIRYRVSEKIAPGTAVLCKLDWDTRFDRMQNHSGEHILSGLISKRFGYHNIGFHLSDKEPVTLLVDGQLSEEQIMKLEEDANRIIYENLPISDSYPSLQDLAGIDYRSKIDIRRQLRLITIGSGERIVDICACCAPHVSGTGAIGLIRIVSVTRMKKGTQLSILCGRRAYVYVTHHLSIMEEIARDFSTHVDNVQARIGDLRRENEILSERLDEQVKESFFRDIKDGKYDHCIFTQDTLSAANKKQVYNELVRLRKGYVGLFWGSDESGYRFYAGGARLSGKILAQSMKEALGAKGGGSEEMIQGAVSCSRQQIESFWESLG